LVKLGFHKFAQEMAAQGHDRIFFDLPYDNVTHYGQKPSYEFGRFRNRLGLDKSKTFHSFRRCMADALNNACVQGTVLSDILGHSKAGTDLAAISAHYLSKSTMDALVAAVKKVKFGVDLKHLLKSRWARV
jgi:integrase